MSGHGDERAVATWKRVEPKLDRLGEAQAEHGQTLARLDRRLSRVEGELDLVELPVEGVRHEVGWTLHRLQDELLVALGRETRVELLAARRPRNES